MRDRMLGHQGEPTGTDVADPGARFDLKQSRGGMIDIEFIVQYLVLAHAQQHPELSRWTDKMRILDELARTEQLAPEEARSLQAAFQAYRSQSHLQALSQLPAGDPEPGLLEHRQAVAGLWHKIFGQLPTAQ